jgi:hypothetical protein
MLRVPVLNLHFFFQHNARSVRRYTWTLNLPRMMLYFGLPFKVIVRNLNIPELELDGPVGVTKGRVSF